jgi:hypothetical protein
MKTNEKNKPKHASDKYRVINFIIVHTHVQKKDVTEMRYTRTCNKSATTMVIASIQIFSSTSWSPFKVACGHSISQRAATCDADHREAVDMTGIPDAVRRPRAEQTKLPHINISTYLNGNVSITKAHSTNRISQSTGLAHASGLKGPDFESYCNYLFIAM